MVLLFTASIAVYNATAQPTRVAGTLNSFFNPHGLWITNTGTSMPGGYPGSIIIDLGGDDTGQSVTTFDNNGSRIIIGGFTSTGPVASDNFALAVPNGPTIFQPGAKLFRIQHNTGEAYL